MLHSNYLFFPSMLQTIFRLQIEKTLRSSDFIQFRNLQKWIFGHFRAHIFKFGALERIYMVHSNWFLFPSMFQTFFLLQNEKILCSSHFIWFNMLIAIILRSIFYAVKGSGAEFGQIGKRHFFSDFPYT